MHSFFLFVHSIVYDMNISTLVHPSVSEMEAFFVMDICNLEDCVCCFPKCSFIPIPIIMSFDIASLDSIFKGSKINCFVPLSYLSWCIVSMQAMKSSHIHQLCEVIIIFHAYQPQNKQNIFECLNKNKAHSQHMKSACFLIRGIIIETAWIHNDKIFMASVIVAQNEVFLTAQWFNTYCSSKKGTGYKQSEISQSKK